MRAIDIMTDHVLTVTENATVSEVAQLLARHRISAVPVVDDANRVIGMVSEGDLLHRAETGTEQRRAWWLDLLASSDQLARDYIKSHSETVKDVMTRDVISVIDTTPVADIAILLETHGIKRVPVLRAGKLVGIVSRANLIHALAMTESVAGSGSDDLAIRTKLLAEMKVQRWAEVAPANVTVNDGVVHLWNSFVSDVEKQALLTLARSIPGVRGIKDHMRKVG